ncbi:MAG TPA: hypothetical protein VF993_02185 [Myxococcales bacterium]
MPALSRSALAAAALIAALGLWSDLSRFQDPLGEKYAVPVVPPGAVDFMAPFQGARALVMGVDPYRNELPELRDPWHHEMMVEGMRTMQFYLPTHLWMYVPLVHATGGDARAAGRIWFVINLLILLALAVVTAGLARDALGLDSRALPALVLFCTVALALHGGSMLGLERGQSDLLTSLLCWSAVASVLRGRAALPMFLATFAALLKGYAAVFALALLLVMGGPRMLRALAGAALALLLLLAPVARYLPEALVNVGVRMAQQPRSVWYNVSFRSLAHAVWPGAGHELALALVLVAIGASACALATLRARREPGRALPLSMMAAATLGTVIGLSSVAHDYVLALVLPGAILLALAHPAVSKSPALAAAVLASLFCLYKLYLGSSQLPLGAIGLFGLVALAGVSSIWPRSPPAPEERSRPAASADCPPSTPAGAAPR